MSDGHDINASPDLSTATTPELLDELARRCDALIIGAKFSIEQKVATYRKGDRLLTQGLAMELDVICRREAHKAVIAAEEDRRGI